MRTPAEYGWFWFRFLWGCLEHFILIDRSDLCLSSRHRLSLSLHHRVKITIRLNLMIPQLQSSLILCKNNGPPRYLPPEHFQFGVLFSLFRCHDRHPVSVFWLVLPILKYKWHFLSLLIHRVFGAEEPTFLPLRWYFHRWRWLLFKFDHIWWFLIRKIQLQDLLRLIISFALSYLGSTFVVRIQTLLQSCVFFAHCL